MKTIALKEQTFQILEDLKKKKGKESFDKLITELVMQEQKIPNSMRGSLKGKAKSFTNKEREEMWGDKRF
jgi:predicted CopG family antitoxin